MSHRHHDPYHKRAKNLAWLGIVIVLALVAFLGIAIWSDQQHPLAPVEQPAVTVDPPVNMEPWPNVPPDDINPPAVEPPAGVEPPGTWSHPADPVTRPSHRVKRHRQRHRHHHVRHHHRHHRAQAAPSAPSCYPSMISGYAADGSVVQIPNTDCATN